MKLTRLINRIRLALCIGVVACVVGLGLTAVAAPRSDGGGKLEVGAGVFFTENAGQWDSRIRYAAQLHDAAIFLEADGMTVALRESTGHPAMHMAPLRCHAYKMHFAKSVGGTWETEGRQEGYSNFFLGDEPGRWRSRVASYASARCSKVFPNIDLEIYSASAALKYNWIVHPGGNTREAVLEYEGPAGVEVTRDGNLRIRTTVRDVTELRPYAFQMVGDREVEVKSRWRVERMESGKLEVESGERWRVWVEVDEYDHSKDLIIDPTLIFSTYTGSSADNWGTTAAYDSHKNVYTAGLVFGVGYPVSMGAYNEYYSGNADIGIFKFDSTGTLRIWATYLGGAAADMPHSMFVNMLDELLVFGTTGSANFPVTDGAYQPSHAGGQAIQYEGSSTINFANGSDIFISRLSADGTTLGASTYIGGSGNDGLNYRAHFNSSYQIIMGGNDSLYYNYGDGARGEIITDDLGNVYVGSTTMSSDFPTTQGSIQPVYGSAQEGVAFKLDYNLRNMLWSTYIGGSADDAVYSIDLDTSYNLLVCGGSNSADFPTTAGAFRTSYQGGSADGFVSKISADGRHMLASSFIGSALYDQLYFVRTGRHNEVFLFGQTKAAASTMIYNAGYGVPGGGMLLVRMLPDLSARRWSTVFGTANRVNLSPTAFAADICNRVYAAGWGRDFVNYNGVQWNTLGTTGMETTADAYQDSTDGQDFYVISLDVNADNLEYATFFGELHQSGSSYGGGDHVDGGTSRFDRLATLYQSVCGSCGGTQGFPTTAGAWSDSNHSSNCNNAIFRFNVTDDFPVAEFLAPAAGCAPYSVSFHNTGRGTTFLWDFGDGTTSTETNPTHTYSQPGRYTVTLIASMLGGCSEADTSHHTLQVLAPGGYAHTPLVGCGGRTQIGMPPTLGASYLWTGDPVSDPTVSNPWVEQNGTYILHTTATGCTQTDTFYVDNYNLIASMVKTPVSCHDSTDGTIAFLLDDEIEQDSVTYTLTPTAPSYTSGDSIVFTNLAPGSYTFTISGYNCTYEQDFTIFNPPPKAYEKETSPVLCSDSCLGWLHLWWQDGGQQADTLIEGLCPGTHTTCLATSDCPITDTTIIGRSRLLDSLHAWADAEHVWLGESLHLHASVAGNAEGIIYSWYPPTDLDRPVSQHPLATPSDTINCYTVTAVSPDGCKESAEVCVSATEVVCGNPAFVIPNAFTPNADGINDFICFNAAIVIEFHIAIFNRWGEKIYESDDPSQCWDGSYRGNPCLPGVYTYTCHIRCHANEENDFKGDITLIR